MFGIKLPCGHCRRRARRGICVKCKVCHNVYRGVKWHKRTFDKKGELIHELKETGINPRKKLE